MKIKALWGFVGDAKKLRAQSGRVRAGEEFDVSDEEYAHGLIGKGLAVAVDGKAAQAKSTKQAAPKENK